MFTWIEDSHGDLVMTSDFFGLEKILNNEFN